MCVHLVACAPVRNRENLCRQGARTEDLKLTGAFVSVCACMCVCTCMCECACV